MMNNNNMNTSSRHSTSNITPNIQIENPNNRKRSDSQPVASPQVISNALLQQDIKRLTSSSNQLIPSNNNASGNNNNTSSNIFAHLIPPLFLPRSNSNTNFNNSNNNNNNNNNTNTQSTSILPSPSKFLRKRRQTLQRNNSNFINENLVDFYLKSGVGTSSYTIQDSTSPTSVSYNSAPTIDDNYYNTSQSPSTDQNVNHHMRHTTVDIIDIIYCDSSMNIEMPYSQYQQQLSKNIKLNNGNTTTYNTNNNYNAYSSYNNHNVNQYNNSGTNIPPEEPMSPGSRKNHDEMAKGAHLIYLLRIRKGNNFSRSWCIEKRYSQFSKLHKSLVKEHRAKLKYSEISKDLELPKLPPKILIGNFKPENVQKRKESLQTYLDLICKGNSDLDSYLSNSVKESEFLSFDSVIEFLKLDLDQTSKIYQLPNDLFLRIFQYSIFEEIFPVLALTCKWWYKIIYQSFKSLDMVYCNENVFFLKKSVAIDIIEDLTCLIMRFNNLVNLRLHSFYELDDNNLNLIIKNCRFLENLEVVDCNLKTPTVLLFRYRNVSLSDNTTVKVIDFSNNRNLTQIHFKNEMIDYGMNNRNIYLTMGQNLCHLDLTNTSITDATLEDMLSQLFGVLQTLNVSQCKKLIQPQIEMKHLETLVMRYCSNVAHPFIKCSGLLYLDLSYTSINDEELWNGVLNQVTSLELLTLKLNSCHELRNLHLALGTCSIQGNSGSTTIDNLSNLIQRSEHEGESLILSKLFRLEMSACKNLTQATFNFARSQLHYVDIRITPISKECKSQLYDFMCNQMEELSHDKPQTYEIKLVTKAHEAYDIFQPHIDFASVYPNSAANSSNLHFSSNHQNSLSSYHQNISRRTSNSTPRYSNHSPVLYSFALLE